MRVLTLATVLSLAACTVAAPEEDPITGDDGSDDGSDSPDPDPDGDPRPTKPDKDPDGAECPDPDLGTIDSLKDEVAFIDYTSPDDPESDAWRRVAGVATPDSEFSMEMFDGYGAFVGTQAAPGDYTIEGVDTDPATCGLCVEMAMTVGEVTHRMAATSGTITLESVDGNLKGSGQTVSFVEVDDNADPVAGGCKARFDRVVFDAPMEPLFPD